MEEATSRSSTNSNKRDSPFSSVYSSSASSTPASIRSRDIFISPSARRKHPSENIILNCCGQRYEVDVESLNRFPECILGTWRKRQRFYSIEHGDYFIDRHRPTFEVVLDYFVYGVLRRPQDIPLDIFVNELCYYNLDKKGLEGFLNDEGILMIEQEKTVKEKTKFKSKLEKVQFKIWQCLEDPQSSKIALCYSVISMVITISSIIMLCIDSLPALETLSQKLDKCHNTTDSEIRTEANHKGDCPKFSVDHILFIMGESKGL